MAKKNIKRDGLDWNTYVNKPQPQALEAIYRHAKDASRDTCGWYWVSITRKKLGSLGCRGAGIVCLIAGTLLQILATLAVQSAGQPDHRLLLTQTSVAVLALGGLLHVADRILGLSSGWLRYITTVTAMDLLTRKFDLAWAGFVLERGGVLADGDTKKLFDIAAEFEQNLDKLQDDETNQWVADFNAGSALLGEMIKTQRETSEKARDAEQAAANANQTAQEARRKAQLPGRIQLKFTYKTGQRPLTIGIDEATPEAFTGSSWTSGDLPPGLRTVKIADQGHSGDIHIPVKVSPDAVQAIDVTIE